MRLTRYLTDDISAVPTKGILTSKQIVERLQKDCSQILKAYKTQPVLWRGAFRWESGNPLELRKGRGTRRPREPRDTAKFMHDYLNAGMKKKVGWPVRSGVPVTTEYDQASSYGKEMIFFPYDGYKYAYVDGMRDLYIYLDDVLFRALGKEPKRMTKSDFDFLDQKPVTLDFKLGTTGKDVATGYEILDSLIQTTVANKPWKNHTGEIFFNTKFYYLLDVHELGYAALSFISKELKLRLPKPH